MVLYRVKRHQHLQLLTLASCPYPLVCVYWTDLPLSVKCTLSAVRRMFMLYEIIIFSLLFFSSTFLSIAVILWVGHQSKLLLCLICFLGKSQFQMPKTTFSSLEIVLSNLMSSKSINEESQYVCLWHLFKYFFFLTKIWYWKHRYCSGSQNVYSPPVFHHTLANSL